MFSELRWRLEQRRKIREARRLYQDAGSLYLQASAMGMMRAAKNYQERRDQWSAELHNLEDALELRRGR